MQRYYGSLISVPPRRLIVLSRIEEGKGDEELPLVIGPFIEGSSLKLSCRAEGGLPAPSVVWFEGDMPLKNILSDNITDIGSESIRSSFTDSFRNVNNIYGNAVDNVLKRQHISSKIETVAASDSTSATLGASYEIVDCECHV